MNLRQTLEFAALVAARSAHVLQRPDGWPSAALRDYWDHSKQRWLRWHTALATYGRQMQLLPPEERAPLWDDVAPILEEIFVTEVLTRTWGALLTAADQHRRQIEVEPLARRTLLGHLEVRQRALKLLVNGPYVSLNQLAELDRLRRRMERWTDLLVGPLTNDYAVADFAAEPRRAAEFGRDHASRLEGSTPERVWELTLLGVRLAGARVSGEASPHAVWQTRVAGAILGCFPDDAFHDHGPLKWLQLLDLERQARRPERPLASPASLLFPTTARPAENGQIRFARLKRPPNNG